VLRCLWKQGNSRAYALECLAENHEALYRKRAKHEKAGPRAVQGVGTSLR